MQVAQRLFSEKGFHGVSIDEIVKELGVSPAVLYRHFPSKESLYQNVLDELACQREDYVKAVVAKDTDFATVLRTMTHIFVRSIANQPDLLKMELHSRLEGNVATQSFFENRWKTFTDYIVFNMNERCDQEYCSATPPAFAALAFQGMVREILLLSCLDPMTVKSDKNINELIDQAVDFFLSAIGYHG